jgi:hypothetical protein
MRVLPLHFLLATSAAFALGLPWPAAAADKVRLLRVPDGGIQPQAVVDAKGTVHLIYFKGDPAAGDVFYAHSEDGEKFSRPLRVNRRAASAIAIGNIRGAHLAVGKGGRVHVTWMGSGKAEPKAPGKATPMLYARLNDAGTAFEPERNVIQSAAGLDGGGSVAADAAGNVYVFWHAPAPGGKGEAARRVWVARSADGGKTFGPEQAAFDGPTGACGCCGMRAFAAGDGTVFALYRSAQEVVHRDTWLLTSADKGATFAGLKLHEWNEGGCPMSSFFLTAGKSGVLAAWETKEQVYFTTLGATTGKPGRPVAAPGAAPRRKHPVVAVNAAGETVLAWTEGMAWDQGGSVAWQVYDKDGRPTAERGRARGVPVWSLVAVFARPDGGFTIVY